MLTGDPKNPEYLRQVIEDCKLRTIQDLNNLKRLVRQAESDHYALYRYVLGCVSQVWLRINVKIWNYKLWNEFDKREEWGWTVTVVSGVNSSLLWYVEEWVVETLLVGGYGFDECVQVCATTHKRPIGESEAFFYIAPSFQEALFVCKVVRSVPWVRNATITRYSATIWCLPRGTFCM